MLPMTRLSHFLRSLPSNELYYRCLCSSIFIDLPHGGPDPPSYKLLYNVQLSPLVGCRKFGTVTDQPTLARILCMTTNIINIHILQMSFYHHSFSVFFLKPLLLLAIYTPLKIINEAIIFTKSIWSFPSIIANKAVKSGCE